MTQLLTPIGRLVSGNVYKARDKDAMGNPLTIKSGPNAGQPRVDYYFGIAIAKAGEQHWAHTAWGKIVYEEAMRGFPGGQTQQPAFAWKITDGDSTVPNGAGRKPCDNEGWRGHWILHFSSSYAPKLYTDNGSKQLVEPGAIKLGYFVQVAGTVESNGNLQKPGVYLNHNMVNLAGYGPEIQTGPDAAAVGFGGALPAGASTAPVGGAFNPAMGGAPVLPPLPGVPALPGAAIAPPQPVAPSLPVLPPPVAVAPHPGFLAPPPPAGPVMTPAAKGATREQYHAAGWSDDQLVGAGLMTR